MLENIKKMLKRFSIGLVNVIFLLAVLFQSCKKNDEGPSSTTGGGAYMRFAAIQNIPSGSNGVRFYFDGKLNVNGDSIIKSPSGSVFAQPTRTFNVIQYSHSDPFQLYPAKFGEDYQDPKLSGIYAYSSTSNYFPNSSHRVPLAPNIGDYNYYKYADVASGVHQFVIKPIYNRVINLKPTEIIGETLVNQAILFEKGLLHTVAVVQTSKLSQDFNLVILKDNPDSIRLKDSTAFIRFVNITPIYFDQDLNTSTNSFDLYIVKTRYGVSGPEVLLQKGLQRFQSSLNLPFTGLDISTEMKDTIPFAKGYAPTNGVNYFELNRSSYTVRVYRSGESALTGSEYLSDLRLDSYVPLLLKDPHNRFQATRNTIYLALGEDKRQTGILQTVYCSFLAFERKDASIGYLIK